jgi:hypothetical protein
MSIFIRLLSAVIVLLGAGIPVSIEAQTPIPKTTQKLAIRWLKTLTVSPTTVQAGTNITAAVTLMRPAVSRLRVDLELVGATVSEVVQYRDCLQVGKQVYVEPDTSRNSFTILTGVTTVGTTSPSTTSRTYTLIGRYGSERISATFTVTRPCMVPFG